MSSRGEKLVRKLEAYRKNPGAALRALRGSLVRRKRSAWGRSVARGEQNAIRTFLEAMLTGLCGKPEFRQWLCQEIKWCEVKADRRYQFAEHVLLAFAAFFPAHVGAIAALAVLLQNELFDVACRTIQAQHGCRRLGVER